VWFDVPPPDVPALSRLCNEYAADLVRERPARFGFFASLPLPNVDAALAEIAHAFDVLHADGIGLPTSFGDVWPGDPRFTPVFAELDRRKALVTLHPYAPNCCSGLLPGVNESILEYPFDTARAVESLLFRGVFVRFRNIRWVVPHGGGPIGSLAGRMTRFASLASRDVAAVAPQGVVAELARLYYDTANATSKATMDALLDLVPPSQLLFGTDFPYLGGKENADGLVALGLPPPTLAAIRRGNVERLIPRLRG
jgi:predicted TIM-barrel fold metal-dependent hydrolase